MSNSLARHFRIAFWAAAAVLAFPMLALAQSDASRGLEEREIVVGSELDYPPYALVTKDGEADGFSVDLMKAVCETMGLKARFRTGPWSEMRSALEKGEIDALPLVSYSKERDAVFDFTVPHTVASGLVFRRKGGAEIESVHDLRDKTIVVMRADAAHDWLVRNDISGHLILVDTVEEGLSLLGSGKGDYAIVPRLVGLITTKKLNLDTIEPTGPLIDAYGRGYGFAVKEGNADLLQILNEGLVIIQRDGTYRRIYDKWFGAVDPRGIALETIVQYGIFGLLILGIVGVAVITWIVMLRRTVAAMTTDLQQANDGLEALVTARTRELKDRNFVLDAVVEGTGDAIFVKDVDGRFLHVNQVIAQNFGMAPGDFIGKNDADIFPPALAAETMARDRAVIEAGEVVDAEEVIPIKGEERVFHSRKAPYRDEHGNVIGVIGIVRDITRRKRSETEAERRHDEVKRLLEAAQAVLECQRFEDAARRIFDACRALTGAASGYVALLSDDGEENEVLFLEAGGLPCYVDPELPMPIRGLRAEAYVSGKVVFDNAFMNSDWVRFLPPGHVEMRNVLFAPLIIDGKVQGIMGLANKPGDFTTDDARIAQAFGNLAAIALRRVRIEEELRKSEARFRGLFEFAPYSINIKDRSGRIVHMNPTMRQWHGLDERGSDDLQITDIIPGSLGQWVSKRDLEVFETARAVSYQQEVTRSDGAKFPALILKFPIRGEDDAVELVGTLAADISERVIAEEALRDRESKLNAIMDNTPAEISLKGPDGRFLSANRLVLDRYGLDLEEFIGKSSLDVDGEVVAREVEEQERLVLEAGQAQRFEVNRVFADGNSRTLLVVRFPVRDAGGTHLGLGSIHFDITDRKKAEEALRRSEERFAKAFRNSPVAQAIVNLDDAILYDVNDRWLEETGYERDEALGRSAEELGLWVDHRQREAFVDLLLREGLVREFEAEYRTKAGAVRKMIVDGQVMNIGDRSRILIALKDVTRQMELEEGLRQAQKLQVVGQLTGGIAHDFNNLLQVVETNLELAEMEVGDNLVARELIDNAVLAGRRGAELTQNLLAFARKQTLQPKVIDLAAFFDEMLGLLGRTLGEGIEIAVDSGEDVAKIRVDETGLINTIVNLGLNSKRAMPNGGVLTITSRNHRLSEQLPIDGGFLPAGPYVEVVVSDEGGGMVADILNRAFEPFFTTKEVGEGSGLGLSMVYGFVRQSGGDAKIWSSVGEGTKVHLLFPALTE